MPVTVLEEVYTPIERPLDQNIDWLLGNTGVWQQLRLKCEFNVYIRFSTTNQLFLEQSNIFTLTSGDNWNDYGFEEGDYFVLEWTTVDIITNSATQTTVPGNIVTLDDNIMYSDNTTLGAGANISNIFPAQGSDYKIYNVAIYAPNKRPQNIVFQPAFMKNSEYNNLVFTSFVDGSQTEFLAKDVDAMSVGSSISMIPLGLQSGMAIETANVKYLGVQNYTHFYEFYMIFMI